MRNKHAHDLIGAYLCGALDLEETRTVEEHLAVCAECREDMQSQSELLAMIPGTNETLSEHERDRIRWSVARTVYKESERTLWRVPIWRALRGLGVTAAAACLFAAGVFVGVRHVGTASGTTVVGPNAPVRRIETQPSPVRPEKIAPAPTGQDAYVVKAPEKPAPPARVRKYVTASPNRTDRRRHFEASEKPGKSAPVMAAKKAAPTPAYEPPEPVRAVKTTVAQLPPDNNGAAAVPLTGDDVRPIRLPVEGD